MMRRDRFVGLILATTLAACGGDGFSPERAMSGGGSSVALANGIAYEAPSPLLDRTGERNFFKGRAFFRDPWVTAPSSTETRDGLGPIFNARACESCHARDGRGRAPDPGEPALSLLVRLGLEDGSPDPTYGGQLQPLSIPGVDAEGVAKVRYEDVAGSYDDGTPYTLRKPTFYFDELAYGQMHADVLTSPRVAPMLIGLGLLEAVPEATIRALADPDDADGDGVSGRVNEVMDVSRGEPRLGRFGLKANMPSLFQQSAGAFNGDIGLTSTPFPRDHCTERQADCRNATSGGDPEILDVILERTTFYAQTLAVPMRRDVDDAEVQEGEALFAEIGCESCHISTLTTGPFPDVPEFEGQTIHPFTDLLVHDMGEGLADGRPDGLADGREWRTPPLWGIGLNEVVNGHDTFLHDGRARGIEEAILWHGGEAEGAQRAFVALDAEARAAVLRFLGSL